MAGFDLVAALKRRAVVQAFVRNSGQEVRKILLHDQLVKEISC